MSSDHEMDDEQDCRATISRLYEFLDNELTEESVAEMRRHLNDCSGCLEAFEFEAELRAMIVCKLAEKIPEHLKSKLKAIISSEGLSPI